MVTYNSAEIYVSSKKTLRDQVIAIDNVITALMATALKAAVNENFTEYILDDGQTKIQCNYRGVGSITASINALEKLKQMYVNRLNGRVIRLVDGKNFVRNPYFNGRF